MITIQSVDGTQEFHDIFLTTQQAQLLAKKLNTVLASNKLF